VTRLDRLVGLAVALAATVGIAGASSFRMTSRASHDAVLRLTWTARPERIEDCRPQSEEALAKLPPHMRQALVCEGTTASYRLIVRRETTVILDEIVRGGGLRHDRPLYVFRDIPVPAGETAIEVRFVRLDDSTGQGNAAASSGPDDGGPAKSAIDPGRRRREVEERTRQRGEAIPPSLLLQRRLSFVPHEVILVTYDPERRELLTADAPHDRH
jgi:hypothetical protein